MLSNIINHNMIINGERGGLAEILCKPKILPLKSAVLEKLEQMEEAQTKTDDVSGDDH